MVIGSGLVGFESNQINLDQTVQFFLFNDSVWLSLEIFETEIIELIELLYYMNLVRTTPIYFLINCFIYFGLFLNTPVYFLMPRFQFIINQLL